LRIVPGEEPGDYERAGSEYNGEDD